MSPLLSASPLLMSPSLFRIVSRPGIWIVAAILLALADLLAPSQMALCVLHAVMLPVAWRLLHRRYVPLLTASMLVAVMVPGCVQVVRHQWAPPGQGDAAAAPATVIQPARIWTMLALSAAGLFHTNLQRKRRRRLALRRELQRHVRRRTDQVRRVNQALRHEVARRQETEHLLDRSETTFKALMDRMQLQVLRKDREGVITYANDTFCKQLGRHPAEVIGSTDHDIYPVALAARYQADDLHVMATGQSVDQVEEHPSPDGQSGFAKVFKAPEYDQHGNCVGIQIIFWDITQEHRGEIALRSSEARKRALFEAAGDAVLLLDADERIVEANPSAIGLFHTPESDMVNHRFDEIAWPAAEESAGDGSPPAPRRRPPTRWSSLPKTQRHEMTLTRGDGTTFESEISVHAIPVSGTAGLAIIVRDVTPQRRAFEALRDAKAAAEAASQTKTEFMAGVSHELRTPLGGITGLTDLLAETTLSPRGRQYVDLIRHSVSQLSDVIEDILDFAAIEAGRLHIAPTPIDLHAVVGEAFKSLAARAVEKPLSLILSIDPVTPRYVIGDAKRLRQIVINVAGNAVKFTPKGEVRMRLSVERDAVPPTARLAGGADGCPITIEVADTGIGIAPEKQRHVFEAFERVETGTTRRFGGTGLGLAISDGLVRRMGGRIELTSEPGVGSVFRCRLRLPLDQSKDGPRPRLADRSPWQAAAARVALSSSIMNAAVRETLGRLGIPCEAVTAPRRGSSNPAPILWIINAERVAELWPDDTWASQQRGENDQVIWVTRVGDGSPPQAHSGDAILIEPVLPDELETAAHCAAAPSAPLPAPAADAGASPDALSPAIGADPPTEAASSTGRLLLVDDSSVNQIVIHDQLAREGYTVDIASNGQEAIAQVDRQAYDCILMDLQMPDIDGTEATRRIHRWYDLRHRTAPPIIALTAHATKEHRQLCRRAGMAGFVTKPISRERLLEEIEYHTGARAHRSSTGGGAEPENSRQADSSGGDPSSEAAPWREQIATFAGGNGAMILSLCEAFLHEVPRLLEQIRRAVEARDSKKLRTSAHTLKSCLRYVASEADVAVAARVEKEANQPERISPEQLDHLETISRHWLRRVDQLRREQADPTARGR